MPFWALTILYLWKAYKDNKIIDWLLVGLFGGFGFLSILIVLICSRNIYFSFIVSFLFAALIVGGSQLQIRMGLDHSIIGIIQATFVLSWLVLQKLELEKLISQKITKVFVK